MNEVTFHMDLEDARLLQRLAELGAHHKAGAGISNRDDDRVLCGLSLAIVQAERRASESRELAVFGPAAEVRA
jgi:hypothetical protein